MQSIGIGLIAALLLVVWALAFSKFQGRVKRWVAGSFAVLLLISTSILRIRGVTGDLVPIFGLRWSLSEASHVISATNTDARVDDSLQFLGPNRNAKIEGVELKNWATHPPREIWRIHIGDGWSAFAVSGNRAVTQEQRDEYECVVAYDILTGRELWIHRDETRYETSIGGIGPRATPTIRGNRVFTAGSTGRLNCLDLTTGSLIWQRDFVAENGAKVMDWGNAGSPLLLGEKVIINAGGRDNKSLVAYHAETGEALWSSGSNSAGYSSPSLHRIAGVDQVLIFNSGAVNAHNPTTGEILWSTPWGRSESVAQPLPLPGDRVFVSSGYGVGCKLYEIVNDGQNLSANMLWATPRLKAKFTNVVYHKGFIYGLDDGVFVCLDPETGDRKWKRGRYGHGQVLLVGSKLIVQTEGGEIVLLDPNPDRHVELARIPALASKTWNNPTLAGSLLLVRNDREAVCFEVNLESAAPL
jgi:outer membrane protein assembly factor BamB